MALSIAFIALYLSLAHSLGMYETRALTLMVVAIGAIFLFLNTRLKDSKKNPNNKSPLLLTTAFIICALLEVIFEHVSLYYNQKYFWFFTWGKLFALGGVVATALPGWNKRGTLLLLALCAVVGIVFLATSPRPNIDVWFFLDSALKHLLSLENPYTYSYENIYSPEQGLIYYGPDVLNAEGRIRSYFYPPMSLPWLIPGYFLGDIRWSHLAAMLGTAAFGIFLVRHYKLPWTASLIALTPVLHPKALFALEQAWIEPFQAVSGASFAWFLVKKKKIPAIICLGLFLATKQHSIIVLPALFLGSLLSFKELGLACIIPVLSFVPFLVLNPTAFIDGLIWVLENHPFRADALNLTAAIWRTFGVQIPAVIGIILSIALPLSCRNVIRGRLGATLITAAGSYLLFFLFAKQAFFNYYWLALNLLVIGFIIELGTQAQSTSKNSAQT